MIYALFATLLWALGLVAGLPIQAPPTYSVGPPACGTESTQSACYTTWEASKIDGIFSSSESSSPTPETSSSVLSLITNSEEAPASPTQPSSLYSSEEQSSAAQSSEQPPFPPTPSPVPRCPAA
ncbi:hypothetical protein FBU31_000451 [Coemansia sp. 'formosensis']|nr:hypothetical protein FBU31_000451 [Coemansia sp. 'formosensis']